MRFSPDSDQLYRTELKQSTPQQARRPPSPIPTNAGLREPSLRTSASSFPICVGYRWTLASACPVRSHSLLLVSAL